MLAYENLKLEDVMQYDPLVEILDVAENSVEHAGKSAAIRSLQIVLREDPSLSKELQKRMAVVLRDAQQGAIPESTSRARSRH
jgi:hypothetical protein